MTNPAGKNLEIGMTMQELTELLGQPYGTNEQFGKTFAVWMRPEGTDNLILVNNKLAKVYSAPACVEVPPVASKVEPPPTESNVDPHALKQLIEKHLARVEITWPAGQTGDWARSFLRRLREDLDNVSLLAAGKMDASLADGKRHSAAVSHSDTFISISTFPCDLDEARRTYYGDGYLQYLNAALLVAQDMKPNCHYVQFQVFCNRRDFWIQFTLFPNKAVLGFDPPYCLPVDILTMDERRKVGLA